MTVNVPERTRGVDNVSDAFLQLLRFRESLVSFTVPEYFRLDGMVFCIRVYCGRFELDDEGTTGRWDQSDFTERCGEGGKEFLSVLIYFR